MAGIAPAGAKPDYFRLLLFWKHIANRVGAESTQDIIQRYFATLGNCHLTMGVKTSVFCVSCNLIERGDDLGGGGLRDFLIQSLRDLSQARSFLALITGRNRHYFGLCQHSPQ